MMRMKGEGGRRRCDGEVDDGADWRCGPRCREQGSVLKGLIEDGASQLPPSALPSPLR